jgi:hypothetical protein
MVGAAGWRGAVTVTASAADGEALGGDALESAKTFD